MNSASVRIEATTFYGWKGYRLWLDDISVGVIPEIGGRIISLKQLDEELLFVQDDHLGETFSFDQISDLREEKRRLGFRLWGGDKTWISPQEQWWEAIPPLELDAGAYRCERVSDGVVMVSPVCRETGLSITRKVRLLADGQIELTQTLCNHGKSIATRGIWDVTQCLRPFDVYLRAKAEQIRAYPNEGDSERLFETLVSSVGEWTCIPCREAAHFKFGGNLNKGELIALRHGNNETLSFSRGFAISPDEPYAHQSMAEIYNSPSYNYLEIEVHAPLQPLAHGETIEHKQTWRLERYSGNLEIDDVVALQNEFD